MKTIIFISHFMGNGGAARVIHTLADALKPGYRVIIASFPSKEPAYGRIDGVQYHDFPDVKKYPERIVHIRKLLKQNPSAVVVAFEYFIGMQTVIAATGLKCRVIVSERNDPHRLDGQPLKKRLRDFLYGYADALVCQTEEARACFSPRVWKKAVVILNPVRPDLPIWEEKQCTKTIINFCRLEKQKNIPLLLEAFQKVHKKYPDYRLAVYGSGKEEANIRRKIEKLHLSDCASLFPFTPDIHVIACKCAVFVSSSDYEGLSNSMLEAMAMGMPVVCTDCPIGGARMVIRDGVNGLLARTGDAQALAEAIERCISAEGAGLGREARAIREELSVANIVKKWEKVW